MNENEIIEEWRPIEGYEDKYEVSSYGKVKSLRNKYGTYREKILKFGKRQDGYLYVNLCKEGKIKTCLVHRLVCQAFLENPNNYTCVNHKDENPSNNCVDNLEWCTYQYNNTYGTVVQRRVAHTDYKAIAAKIDYKAIGRKNAEKLSRQVYQYDKNEKLVAIWKSVNEAGRNGFNSSHVSNCCLGKRKSHKGYIWSYTELKKQEN